jgi:hypothetical protein
MMGFGIESRPSWTVKSGSTGGGDVVIVVLQHSLDLRYLGAELSLSVRDSPLVYRRGKLPETSPNRKYGKAFIFLSDMRSGSRFPNFRPIGKKNKGNVAILNTPTLITNTTEALLWILTDGRDSLGNMAAEVLRWR